jgi:hypothetical protein
MKHKHHIIPRHVGGSNDPSNLIELTVEEHAQAHKKLWEEDGRWQDYVAWQGLSGIIISKEVHSEATKLGMKHWWNNLTEEQKQEYKQKCSKRPDNYIPHTGHTYTHSETAKMKISEFQKSYKKTEKHRENISTNRKGKALGNRNSMSSEENRKKVSDSKIGRKLVVMPDGTRRYIKPESLVG